LNSISFTLRPLPPFRLDLTAWVLRRRPENVIDRWEGETYRRVLMLDGVPVELAVTQEGPPDEAVLRVVVNGDGVTSELQPAAAARLEWMLDTRRDLSAFYRVATGDPHLGPLAERFRGVKPARYPTVFEALVNAVACQQITLNFAIRLLNRLTVRYGAALEGKDGEEGTMHAFPEPEALAEADPEEMRRLEISGSKARAIIGLAREVVEGHLRLEDLATLDDAAAIERLCRLRGVGPWTAESALVRGLGRIHVLPRDDSGARNSVRRWLGITDPLEFKEMHRLLERWETYGGLIYFHLLLNRLSELGYVS
jgi:DNA-3-methyladenine glycosylase II